MERKKIDQKSWNNLLLLWGILFHKLSQIGKPNSQALFETFDLNKHVYINIYTFFPKALHKVHMKTLITATISSQQLFPKVSNSKGFILTSLL